MGNLQLQQIAMPVHLLLCTDNSSFANAYAMFGGYYKYILSGKDGGNSIDFTNDYNQEHYGISYGFGMDVMKIQVNVVLQYSLTGLYKSNSMEDVRESGVYFNMGYRF